MERLTVLLEGRKCGELVTEPQGLYVRYRAVCRLPADAGPTRLFAVGREGELRLGVPQPEGGVFLLERQLSAREARGAGRLLRGELRLLMPRDRGWQKATEPMGLFRDPRLGRQLQEAGGVLVCREEERRFLAVPFAPGRAFPLAELFCLARIRRIGQGDYAVFCIDREGRPMLP